jgi:hypothetical protein
MTTHGGSEQKQDPGQPNRESETRAPILDESSTVILRRHLLKQGVGSHPGLKPRKRRFWDFIGPSKDE